MIAAADFEELEELDPDNDGAVIPGEWRQTLMWTWERRADLDDRDHEFLNSLRRWNRQPTPKQVKWLHDIRTKLVRRSAA